MPPRRDLKGCIFAVTLFTTPFLLILAYFRLADVYNRHFFESGVTAPYNLLRTVFIAYLFGAICVPGFAVLSALGGASALARQRPLARLTAAFFSGAALWHGLLLLLGLLGLYTYPVAVALSVPAVMLTPIYVGPTVRDLYRDTLTDLGAPIRSLAWTGRTLAVIALLAALLLLIVKGLFPAGGHDYFNHYHTYYQSVIDSHGIWPNDVWYQFYYSKGMGLFFLATLLTDPLAPSLVTYCFVIASGAALFLLIERMSAIPSFWPWVAVIAFLVFYTYTPGVGEFRGHGGWGDFQKPHEIDAAFVIGFVWLSVELSGAIGRERHIWFLCAATCFLVIGIVELVTVLLLGLFTTSLLAIALIRRRWEEARSFFGLCVVGGCGLAGVLALNYAATGLASDQLIRETWSWVDLPRLARWGALPYAIILLKDRAAMQPQGTAWLGFRFIAFYQDLLRIDLLKPLLIKISVFLLLLSGAAIVRFRRSWRGEVTAPLALVLLLLLVVALAAIGAGNAEPVSFYRYTSFCLPLVLALAACGWLYIVAPIRSGWLSRASRHLLPLILLVAALSQFWINQKRFLYQVIPNAIAFADGATSIREAYGDQQGWPGRQPWGGIFPGTVGAWREAGPGARIWSMHLAAYCMLPQCRYETFFSLILSPHLFDMLAGSAEETRDILQREGLNYYFYTTAMDFNDILPLTKTFAPDRIADYLGVKWTDGTSYLLTWLGPGVTPLTPEWVAQYKASVAHAPYLPASFPLGLMLDVREQMRADPHWGRQLHLPGIAVN